MTNIELPKLIINLIRNTKTKLICYGTFFEKEVGNYMRNYIESKKNIFDYIKRLNSENIYYLRLEHIYGKYDSKHKFIPSTIEKIKKGERLILDDPYTIRDFTPVKHIVRVSKKLSKTGLNSKLPEIGTGTSQTTYSFINKLLTIFANNDQDKYHNLLKKIVLKDNKMDVIRNSYCVNPKIYPEYDIEYFKQLEKETIDELIRE